MTQIVWSRQAQEELLAVADYYDRIDPALANKLVWRVENAAWPLLDFPAMGERVGRQGARKWRVPGTPFLLFYDVAGDRVEIAGVGHVRSDWRSKR